MTSQIILCSTTRVHYAIENDIRYELSPSLILSLKQYLKGNLRKGKTDLVSYWVANLPENVQKQIRVFPYYNMVA
jgi:hypothetical protein